VDQHVAQDFRALLLLTRGGKRLNATDGQDILPTSKLRAVDSQTTPSLL
jgi:hypothetical protein